MHSADYHYTYTLRQKRSDETLGGSDRHKVFCQAVVEGQLPRIRNFLSMGIDLDEKSSYGLTALHCAVLGGHDDVVAPLIEAGSDVNANSDDFGTPLCLAALKGMCATVSLLLRYRAKPDTRTKRLGTALHCSILAVGDHRDIVTALLAARASVSSQATIDTRWLRAVCSYDGDPRGQMLTAANFAGCILSDVTPAFLAIRYHYSDLLEPLLPSDLNHASRIQFFRAKDTILSSSVRSAVRTIQKGINESTLASHHHTLLSSCATIGDIDSARLLIAKGATPRLSDKDVVPLICAAAHGSTDMVALLLEHGASVNQFKVHYEAGSTALHWAAAHGHDKIIRVLCEHGAVIDSKDSQQRTPMFCALHGFTSSRPECGALSTVEALIDCGADPNPRGLNDMTPLLSYLESDAIDNQLLEGLVKAGADTSARASDGTSVLGLCMPKAESESTISAISRGLGFSASTAQRVYGKLSMIRDKYEDWEDRKHLLLYWWARGSSEDLRLVRLLGGDVDTQNSRGWTALHCAAEKDDVAAIRRLLAAGASMVKYSTLRGRSQLAVAVYYQNIGAVRFLLRHGADPHAKGTRENAQSAIDVATERKQVEMLHLLNTMMELLPVPASELAMTPKRQSVPRDETEPFIKQILKPQVSPEPQLNPVVGSPQSSGSRRISSAATQDPTRQAAEPCT